MAPSRLTGAMGGLLFKRRAREDEVFLGQLKTEWVQPVDVLTVVMIIGGDVVQSALAQLVGGWYTPVPFSFGWVAYSFTSLILAVGENKLMPESDTSSLVINAKVGHARDNKSWVLGRILRDYEYWQPKDVKVAVERLLDGGTESDREKAKRRAEEKGVIFVEPPRRRRAGLCVAVYDAPGARAGLPDKDWLYLSGVAVTIVQLGISIIPWILFGDWLIFLVTSAGTLLAIASGGLPQWRQEKWECRRGKKIIALTRGNGAQHVLLINGVDDDSLDLEDLAAGALVPITATRYYTAILAFLWLIFLVTVTGINDDPWFLMAVGGIGMMQNVFVAGAPRRPGGFGVHLQFREIIARVTVMDTLKDLENKYPSAGASLLDTFFPGKRRPEDVKWWEEAETRAEQSKAKKQREKDSSIWISAKDTPGTSLNF